MPAIHGYAERRFSIKNLTPQPPSLPGKGEVDSPRLVGEGLGERWTPLSYEERGWGRGCSRISESVF